MKKIIVAIDSFKGCLTSAEANQAAAEGILDRMPEAKVVQVPVSDGGEGWLEAFYAAIGGELVGAIEKHHEERYRKLLKNIEDAVVFSREGDVIWQCSNCGHIVIGKKAPEVCPTCDHPQSYFQIKAENY